MKKEDNVTRNAFMATVGTAIAGAMISNPVRLAAKGFSADQKKELQLSAQEAVPWECGTERCYCELSRPGRICWTLRYNSGSGRILQKENRFRVPDIHGLLRK